MMWPYSILFDILNVVVTFHYNNLLKQKLSPVETEIVTAWCDSQAVNVFSIIRSFEGEVLISLLKELLLIFVIFRGVRVLNYRLLLKYYFISNKISF